MPTLQGASQEPALSGMSSAVRNQARSPSGRRHELHGSVRLPQWSRFRNQHRGPQRGHKRPIACGTSRPGRTCEPAHQVRSGHAQHRHPPPAAGPPLSQPWPSGPLGDRLRLTGGRQHNDPCFMGAVAASAAPALARTPAVGQRAADRRTDREAARPRDETRGVGGRGGRRPRAAERRGPRPYRSFLLPAV
jgi:hypothetical protein